MNVSCARASWVGAAVLAAMLSVCGSKAVAQETNQYARWEHDASWNDLTNHIRGCYVALVDRCEAAGVDPWDIDLDWCYEHPVDAYGAFAYWIEDLCPSFVVCQTNGVPITDFQDYFATPGSPEETSYPSSLPRWTPSDLRREAGITNWATAVRSWVACDKGIQEQVRRAIDLLRYTAVPASPAPCQNDSQGYLDWFGYGWPDALEHGARYEWSGFPYALANSSLPLSPEWFAKVNGYSTNIDLVLHDEQEVSLAWNPFPDDPVRPGWRHLTDVTCSIQGELVGMGTMPPISAYFRYPNSQPPLYSGGVGAFSASFTNNTEIHGGYSVAVHSGTVTMGDTQLALTHTINAVTYLGPEIWAIRKSAAIRMASDIATNYACERQLYVAGTTNELWWPFDTVAVSNPVWAPEAGLPALMPDRLVLAETFSPSSSSNSVSEKFCRSDAPYAGETLIEKGWAIESGQWLLKWQFPSAPAAGTNQPVELTDIDEDGIVEVGADVESFGPDTGVIFFRPDADRPQVIIPLAMTPLWSANLPVHVYLSQGAVTYPVSFYAGGPDALDDGDGPWQALSLNTRIIENVCVASASEKLKKVVLLRPRGNIVAFDFPWDPARGEFSAVGYPTGANSTRTYVLRDVTPANPADFDYELYFDSGIIHSFRRDSSLNDAFGWIKAIRHVDGRTIAVDVHEDYGGAVHRSVPGCAFGDAVGYYSGGTWGRLEGAVDGRYASSNTWVDACLQQVSYQSRTGEVRIVCTPVYDGEGWITALRKTGVPDIEKSDVSISVDEKTLTYSWGTIHCERSAAAGHGRTITFIDAVAGLSPVQREYDFNADDRLVEARVLANGGTARTAIVPKPDAGRYQNGSPKNSRVDRITWPDASFVAFGYDPINGWLVSATNPISQELSRVTRYDYATHGAGDSGDKANPTNLVERPRTVEEYAGSLLVGRTLYSYGGAVRTVVRVCTNAMAGWDDVGNLCATNSRRYYATSLFKLLNYLPQNSSSPTLSGWSSASPDSYTAPRLLTVSETFGDGRSRVSRINAFGNVEYAASSEDGVTLSSETSTADPLGRILGTVYLDGSSTSNSQYGLFGPQVVREADGSETRYEYTDRGQVKVVRQPALDRSTAYEHDGLQNVVKAVETAGNTTRTTSYAFDVLGRMTSLTAPLGTTGFRYESTATGTRKTTTNPDPDHSVLIEDFNFDGSVAEIQGSAAVAHLKYNYGVDAEGFYTEEIRVADDGDEKEKVRTYQNMLGAPCKTVLPTCGGGTVTAQSLFDQKGRFVGSVDLGGFKSLTQYNAKNQVSESGVHVNGDANQLTPASDDRFQSYSRTVDAANGIVSSTQVYPRSGDGSPQALSSSRAMPDGKSGSSSYAGRTDSWGRSAACMTDGQGGCYSETNTFSDGSRKISVYRKWQLDSVTTYNSGGSPTETESYEYYEFGEMHRVINNLHGITTYVRDPDTAFLTDVIPADVQKGATHYEYDAGTARVKMVTKSDGSITRYEYWPNGLLKREYDVGSYDTRYVYDSQGRKKAMTTMRNGLLVTTRWEYDARTGLLARKIVNGVVTERYDYRDDNRLASVTDAEEVTATCHYSPLTGDLVGVTTSDGAGSATGGSFDRMGRMTGAWVLGGIGETFAYALDGGILTNTITGNGIIADATLSRVYDPRHGGLVSLEYRMDPSNNGAMTVGYNDGAKVGTIRSGDLQVRYVYTNSAFVSAVSANRDGSNVLTRSVDWDMVNKRIKSISYQVNGNSIAGYVYHYPTNSDRIAEIVQQDGTRWVYVYDPKGELISARKYNADMSDVPGMQFGYAYDEIGNTLKAGVIGEDGEPLYRFEADDFNFHTNRIWGRRVPVQGNVAEGINVTLNGIPAQQGGGRFSVLVPVDNVSASLQTNLTVWAVKTNVTPEIASSASGTVYVAQSAEQVRWKSTGVLSSDSRFAYQWNRFGQLVSATSINATPSFRVTFDYYADGRRARKQVWQVQGAATNLVRTHQFHYDRWNLISESVTDYAHTPTLHYSLTFLWGLDLSGQRNGKMGQEAGGIGGLLAITVAGGATTNVYFPVSDHNGTIHALVDADTGQVVAQYEYSPFGALISESHPASGVQFPVSPFLFQSKYYDAETGLYYFGYRYYDPASTKWLSRDPKGESGGLNLTCFCGNDPVNGSDPLGLDVYVVYRQFNDIKEGGELAAQFNGGKPGSIGHVYLAFDEVGVDRDKWEDLVTEYHADPTSIVPSRNANRFAETFSFHPWGVREMNGKSDLSSDIGKKAGLPEAVVTEGSYIGYNDSVDQNAFLDAKKLRTLNGVEYLNFKSNKESLDAIVVKISTTEEEQFALYRQVQESRRINNISAESGDIGSYSVTWRNCGYWAVTMLGKPKLHIPSMVRGFNKGVGVDPDRYLNLHRVGQVLTEGVLRPASKGANAIGAQWTPYSNENEENPAYGLGLSWRLGR